MSHRQASHWSGKSAHARLGVPEERRRKRVYIACRSAELQSRMARTCVRAWPAARPCRRSAYQKKMRLKPESLLLLCVRRSGLRERVHPRRRCCRPSTPSKTTPRTMGITDEDGKTRLHWQGRGTWVIKRWNTPLDRRIKVVERDMHKSFT